MSVEEAPYGAWSSPLSALDAVTSGAERRRPMVDGSTLWWLEARPEDGGRVTLVRRDEGGSPVDVSAPGDNVRTRYLEYGGGEAAVADGIAVFVEFSDQRVRRAEAGETHVLTPDSGGLVRGSRASASTPCTGGSCACGRTSATPTSSR